MKIFVTIFSFLIFINGIIYAHGECCLSRSLAEATISGVTIAPNFGLSLHYEYTNMETIREGSHSISPNSVLDNVAAEWSEMLEDGKSFSVPTRMIMQEYTLLGTYAVTDRIQLLATVPYVINDMDMRMVTRGAGSSHHHHAAPLARQTYLRPLASDTTGNDMRMDMKMDTVFQTNYVVARRALPLLL